MNKKLLLTLAFLFASIVTALAQNNEALGDNAMSSGNYDKAVEYYMAAMSQNATDVLSEKLNKATMLKNEFKAIDKAVADRDKEEMEIHIANVLAIDPNNRFIEAKRSQLSSNVTQHNTEKRKANITGIFIGDDNKADIFGFASVDQGVGIITVPNMSGNQGITLLQRAQLKFMSSFPIVFDFQTQLGITQRHKMWGLGIGSCFFVGDHITLDYGIGLQRNWMAFNAARKEKGYYYRAGITYMSDYGVGMNYSFNRNMNKTITPFNCHQVTVLFRVGEDNKTVNYIAGTLALLWHSVAAAIVFSDVKL